MTFHVPNNRRVRFGPAATDEEMGNNGCFIVGPAPRRSQVLRVIASDGGGWEHVSVSLPNRIPSWEEMVYVRDMFWDPEDAVMQLHPPHSSYVNNHPFCLHLWRPIGVEVPTPPMMCIG